MRRDDSLTKNNVAYVRAHNNKILNKKQFSHPFQLIKPVTHLNPIINEIYLRQCGTRIG